MVFLWAGRSSGGREPYWTRVHCASPVHGAAYASTASVPQLCWQQCRDAERSRSAERYRRTAHSDRVRPVQLERRARLRAALWTRTAAAARTRSRPPATRPVRGPAAPARVLLSRYDLFAAARAKAPHYHALLPQVFHNFSFEFNFVRS